jgi:hypothetical protein
MAWTDNITFAFQEGATSTKMNLIGDNFDLSAPHLLARKTSDEPQTSTTLQDDDALFTPSIAANEVWQLRLYLYVVTGSGAAKSSFSFPTGGELLMTLIGFIAGGTQSVQQARITATDGAAQTYVSNSTGRLWIQEVLFINGGTAGPVTFRWALDSAGGTSTVKANSTLWGAKLA